MSWYDTEITLDSDGGWWCGGQYWESEAEARLHQIRLTSPTQSSVTHDGRVTRHTSPVTRDAGILGYDMWFEFGGIKFIVLAEVMQQWKRRAK